MIIKRFLDFVNESYLKGGRQPLYHYSRTSNLTNIMKDDVLKMGRVARPRGSKAICLTRSPYFTHDGGVTTSPRIVLNHDKLRNDVVTLLSLRLIILNQVRDQFQMG